MFFTTFFTSLEPEGSVVPIDRPIQLPNGVWRWDPVEQALRPVITRLDIPIPNGIAVSPDQRTLYVTDSLGIAAGGVAGGNAGYAPTAGPNTYVYDLDEDMLPINRRVFALARSGYPDGIHVDDYGCVWTAEGEGIVVRNPQGTILALFPQEVFGVHEGQIANFALANDTLVVAAMDRLYVVRLGIVVATGQT
jgi:gluconolactonase